MDKSTTKELIEFIIDSIDIIKKRFSKISTSDDFLKDDDGLEKLDSIAMRIQSIGEAVKNLDKREKELLLQVADSIYWSEIIKARDFISHHYIDLDAEAVYDICENHIFELEANITKLRNILQLNP
ncbi:MAG: HepT-like ribonuclease domain-containing protein [Arcobacteraceae bacterium]